MDQENNTTDIELDATPEAHAPVAVVVETDIEFEASPTETESGVEVSTSTYAVLVPEPEVQAASEPEPAPVVEEAPAVESAPKRHLRHIADDIAKARQAREFGIRHDWTHERIDAAVKHEKKLHDEFNDAEPDVKGW